MQIYGCVSKLKPQQRVQGHPTYAPSHENRPRKVAERTIYTSSGHNRDCLGGEKATFLQSINTLHMISCIENI